jgi:steroid delta-isomerase-like uncharacterized protein
MAESAHDVARANVEAFNAGDWERFRETLTDDSIYEEMATQRRVEGPDAIIEVNRGWKSAFPDARGTIEKEYSSGDTITQEITWEGTQSGPLETPTGELPPSGRRVVVKAVQVIDVEGGKEKSTRHYFDMLGMLEQLGAMQEPAAH